MVKQEQQDFLKDSTLIIAVLYRMPDIVKVVIDNVLSIISGRPNTWIVLINNNAEEGIKNYFDSVDHKQCLKIDLPFNFGRGLACNFFIKEYLSNNNLPKTIIALDPDIIFTKESFEKLVEAAEQLPQCGMIGMRYKDNECNPERNLFFKPKTLIGINKKKFKLSSPFMCNVAGGIFAIEAKKITTLCDYQLFPKKKIRVYGGDDSALYNCLRWKCINGYLEGTQAIHLTSAGCIAEEFLEIKNNHKRQ
tara:strand:+ start:101 stop:847 length:747 start_codon:yes stop_codon:yes gene_type:complete